MSQSREEALARLEANHKFPGPFSFKAIGPNEQEFATAFVAAIALLVGAEAPIELARRPSAGGRHQALTATLEVASAGQVLAVYAALQPLPGLKMLL